MDLAKFHLLSEREQEEILQDYADLKNARPGFERTVEREGASTPPAGLRDMKRVLNSPETPYKGGPKKVPYLGICNLHFTRFNFLKQKRKGILLLLAATREVLLNILSIKI